MNVLVIAGLFLSSSWLFAQGFRTPDQVAGFPLKNADRSIFKIEIDGAKMYGTAFAISADVLITNVHNITQCLAEYGLVESGYDGLRGPLKCRNLGIEDGMTVRPISLLGSNSRHSNDSHDFAAIQVANLNAVPLSLSLNPITIGQPTWIIGYPSETYRSKIKASDKQHSLLSIIELTFEFEQKIRVLDPVKNSAKEVYEMFTRDAFVKIQPFSVFSEFLSGALIGSSWSPFSAWQYEDSATYQRNLLNHLSLLRFKTYSLLTLTDSAIQNDVPLSDDADDTLRVSSAKIHGISPLGIMNLEGDATPGSSGSAILNPNGNVLGILFQLRTLDGSSDARCVLDVIMTSFESIRYNYCSQMGLAAVSALEIDRSLRDWGVVH